MTTCAKCGAIDEPRCEEVRLRALPVIATCGDCPSVGYRIMLGDDRDADPIVCTSVNKSEAARATGAIVDPLAAPPAWCPLRKAAR